MYIKRRIPSLLIISLLIVSFNSAIISSEHINQYSPIDTEYREFSIDLAFNPSDFEYETVETKLGLFASIKLPGEGFNYIQGQPKLPTIRRLVEIPIGANPIISISDISWYYTSLEELNLPAKIVPSQSSIEKIPQDSQEFHYDSQYYLVNQYIPDNYAKIVEIGNIRSHRFALIEISPVQYNPFTGELKLMNLCEIKITCPNANLLKTNEKIEKYYSKTFEKYYDNAFINHDSLDKTIENRGQERFLIIVYDDFKDEIQPLVNWKQTLGYEVTTTKTSEIPGGSKKEDIFNYIEDAYYNWDNPPVFVLLVGDTDQIPTFTGIASPTATDLFYVTVDGEDYFPDIFLGRFPASEEVHVQNMVAKTLYYEIGNFTSNDWIKKAAFIASIDFYYIAEETHNYVIEKFLDPLNYTSDKLYCKTYGATSQDVHDAINDGRSLVIYSGHGAKTGWTDGPPFYKSDVQQLTNVNMYPFVCSYACDTNSYIEDECFGETWLREADKGALAFWGSSSETYWIEDDVLEKAMFQAWFEDGLYWIGGMTDMALLYLYENYSGGGYTRYYFEAYNVMGDPSVELWSDDPNRAPETPDKPDGPSEGIERMEQTITAYTTDFEGQQLYYKFDWGDETQSIWYGPYDSGEEMEVIYVWDQPGEYEIKVIAKDIFERESYWSESHTITIVDNQHPKDPILEGKRIGKTGEPYEIIISSIDPEGYNVMYYISWGDGDVEYWLGPNISGQKVEFSHYFKEGGSLTITVKAKDILNDESNESLLNIYIIKNRARVRFSLFEVLIRVFENFPIIKNFLINL
jgi:hypothetical protein